MLVVLNYGFHLGSFKDISIFVSYLRPVEKEMATHSSILAWRIPGTEEPVGCRLWGRTESDMTKAT